MEAEILFQVLQEDCVSLRELIRKKETEGKKAVIVERPVYRLTLSGLQQKLEKLLRDEQEISDKSAKLETKETELKQLQAELDRATESEHGMTIIVSGLQNEVEQSLLQRRSLLQRINDLESLIECLREQNENDRKSYSQAMQQKEQENQTCREKYEKGLAEASRQWSSSDGAVWKRRLSQARQEISRLRILLQESGIKV